MPRETVNLPWKGINFASIQSCNLKLCNTENQLLKHSKNFSPEGGAVGFSAIAQNPEFMAAIGKSFANQTATLSKMVEEDEREEYDMMFECSSCHFVLSEESMSYSDNSKCGWCLLHKNLSILNFTDQSAKFYF